MTSKKTQPENRRLLQSIFFLLTLLLIGNSSMTTAQVQPNYLGQQPQNNYMQKSVAFKQEIMRMEINVQRNKVTLPITQVPRVGKNDVIKLRLLDEAVGGIKPHQSLWDWTFLVAFINPNRRADTKIDGVWQNAVSQEIQFRKTGWYREYSFTVPYDSQPVFFLYPQGKNREKILKLIGKNYNEVRKLGEKTIEIAGAYAQISSFLNDLQGVLFMSQYSRYSNNGMYGGYNSYGSSYNSYGNVNPYNPYNPYGTQPQNSSIPFNYNVFIEQSIERLAKGFNVTLPSCWQNNGSSYGVNGSQYGSTYGGYGSYGGSFGTNQNNFGYAVNQELISRAQCVAKNIRMEDFDLSISRLLQQGGVLLAAQLREKYPQFAYWISIAATAIDFIVKVFQKAPLRLVPTLVQSSDGLGFGNQQAIFNAVSGGGATWGGATYNNNNSFGQPAAPTNSNVVKLSLYAENQPDDMQFVTAYPVITHKWQAEPDPEVISLYPPVLAESCLHVGTNLLKNTDLGQSWTEDNYARDFRLVFSDKNGYKKEFSLRKNIGLGGWELNLTQEDLNQIPKIKMNLEAEINGFRGFNEVKSPKFELPLSSGGNWEVTSDSQRDFSIGGRRVVTLRNTLGSCRCLQRVIYKPSFGGQFVFEAESKENGLLFSPDGREVSFVIDTTNFRPGAGTLEVQTYGGDVQPQTTPLQTSVTNVASEKKADALKINLYPLPPKITGIKISKGDRQAILFGERLEQIKSAKINGKLAVAVENYNTSSPNPPVNQTVNSPWNVTPTVSQNVQTNPLNERTVVFEDPRIQQIDKVVSLELGLEDNRTFQINETFPISLSRPTIIVGNNNEVEAEEVFNVLPASGAKRNSSASFPFSLKETFPIETREITLRVKNALTDYDFKFENLSVETRIEKSQVNPSELPQANFVVLDWKNLELKITVPDTLRQMLGGRRIQFRIRDRERGDSDWFTVKQTFVRIPEITSVRCLPAMQGKCEMKGEGLEFIQQISTDGGLNWTSEDLQIQPTRDGQKAAKIPMLLNKKLLQIKLRDYPLVPVGNWNNFVFGSTAGAAKVR